MFVLVVLLLSFLIFTCLLSNTTYSLVDVAFAFPESKTEEKRVAKDFGADCCYNLQFHPYIMRQDSMQSMAYDISFIYGGSFLVLISEGISVTFPLIYFFCSANWNVYNLANVSIFF